MTSQGSIQLRFRALRLGFKALRLLSPDLALRGAERLFSSPQRHPEPEAERAAKSRGRSFRFRSQGLWLQAHAWGEGPAILCLHGWEGRGAQFHPFIRPLAEAGFSVLTFDQPGHGASQGSRSGPLDWAQAILDLVAEVGPISGLVAHSLGGAAAAIAMDRGLRTSRVVLLAPPARPEPFYFGLLSLLGFPETEHPGAFRAWTGRAGVAPDRVQLVSLALDRTTPALVIHDRGDREVPWSDGAAVAAAWPGATLLSTEGLGHRRILREAAVIQQTIAFLKMSPKADAPSLEGDCAPGLDAFLFRRDQRVPS